MKKILYCCFLFFIFSFSVFTPKLTIKNLINDEMLSYKPLYNTGDGVIASKIGLKYLKSCFLTNENNGIIGEMVTIDKGKDFLNVIIDKLGLIILQKMDLNSCIVVLGKSKLIPYKNISEDYNVQMKVYSNSIVIASPNFIN